ncbi:Prostaglandin G/H synthase 2 [Armadillidium nasatum]|uniref:Prostaglandin G/H synthase 2 n=1 Tax=Armadillidium nasatum TaxID=96803 RepID=A0A5N5SR41_9CRUS|nr:Prostaglandin G/H synthase 2 [Armadillidium nasatum]
MLMKYIYMSRGALIDAPPLYESDHTYITLDAHYNESYFARMLPPVPMDCPTQMGTKGPKELIPSEELFKRMFLRREFKPDPSRFQFIVPILRPTFYASILSNGLCIERKVDKRKMGSKLLYDFFSSLYALIIAIKYRSSDLKNWIKIKVDVSNIYGLTEEIRQGLRSKVDGKLKTKVINGGEFPPLLKDVEGVTMDYPPNAPIPDEAKFALGHPFFALLPGLFVYATIWVREHNRVCDILKAEHPHWDDEQLYQTARLIIVGEVITITIEDYVQHLSQYRLKLTFNPELVHGTEFQFSNRIYAEFDQLYHWHPFVPDGIKIQDKYYTIMDMAFSNQAVFSHGLESFIEAMATNRAGALTARNHPAALINTEKGLNYHPIRVLKNLPAKMLLSKELEDIYKDIDAVEFYVGLLAEEPGPSLTGLTMVNVGGPWSVKGLISNPICSPGWWKPSTFGGEVGFNIVKTASLKKLFCNNIKGPCDHIAFLCTKEHAHRLKTISQDYVYKIFDIIVIDTLRKTCNFRDK